MPEIIPNKQEYLNIPSRILDTNEDYLVLLREGRSHIVILGLNEWLKWGKARRERGIKHACGKTVYQAYAQPCTKRTKPCTKRTLHFSNPAFIAAYEPVFSPEH